MNEKNRVGKTFPYSPRAPCAALAAYFFCTGLRIKRQVFARRYAKACLFTFIYLSRKHIVSQGSYFQNNHPTLSMNTFPIRSTNIISKARI